MLERAASTCLNSSSRLIARSSKTSIRSRHQLHTSFWHHGAANLPLPAWWTIIEPIASSIQLAQQGGHEGMLDFLYPAKTLALMKRISERSLRKRRIFGTPAARLRTFSSKSGKVEGVGEQGKGIGHAQIRSASRRSERLYYTRSGGILSDHAKSGLSTSSAHLFASLHEQPDPRYHTAQPLQELEKLFKGPLPAYGGSEDYEKVWQLYLQLEPDQRTQRILIALLNHLSFSTRSVDIVRSGFLLDSNPSIQRESQKNGATTKFWSALLHQLRAGNAEGAVSVHESAISTNAQGYIGTNLLLAQLIQAKEWDLALQVYSSKMATISDADKGWLQDDRADVWDIVAKVPRLLHLTSVILDQMKRIASPNTPYIQDFVDQLILKAAVQAIQRTNLNRKDLKNIKELVETHASQASGLHGAIIRHIISIMKTSRVHDENYLDLSKLLADMYDKSQMSQPYHLEAGLLVDTALIMAKSAPVAAKSQEWASRQIIFAQKVKQIISKIEALDERRSTQQLLWETTLRMYAQLGKVDEVLNLFNKLSSESSMSESLALPVLELFAQRTEPAEALIHFQRLGTEFDWQPTTRVWNTLLRAFSRADDIEQCIPYFEKLRNSGVPLDRYSFLPLIQLYSRRGESAKIVELLEMAQGANVEMEAKMFFYLVVAHLENSDMAAAEKAAYALTQAKKQGNLRGPLTLVWNHVLEAYAIQRDWHGVQRVYRNMLEQNVRPDTKTHAALIEALCRQHKTADAWAMLQKLSKENKTAILATHYRAVILGFVVQRQPKFAVQVYDAMHRNGIKPDAATTAAYMRAKSLRESHNIEPSNNAKPIIQAKFREKYDEITHAASADPAKGTRAIFGGAQEAAAATLITNYGSANLPDTVTEWFNLYSQSQTETNDGDLQPMVVLRSMMVAFLRVGNDTEVQKCWEQYVQQAEKFASDTTKGLVSVLSHENTSQLSEDESIVGQDTIAESSDISDLESVIQLPEKPAASSQSTHDLNKPSMSDPKSSQLEKIIARSVSSSTQVPLFSSRRHLLSAPLVLYMRSLSGQGKRPLIRSTVLSLLKRGWLLDNIAWNEYVRCLVARTAPEESWPGDSPSTPWMPAPNEQGAVESSPDVKKSQVDAGGFDDSPVSYATDEIPNNFRAAVAKDVDPIVGHELPTDIGIVAPSNMDTVPRSIVSVEDAPSSLEDITQPTADDVVTSAENTVMHVPKRSEHVEDLDTEEVTFNNAEFQAGTPKPDEFSQSLEDNSGATEVNPDTTEPLIDSIPFEVDHQNQFAETVVESTDSDNNLNEQQTTSSQGAILENAPVVSDEDHLQDEPSPSDILNAFRICENHLMPNFPGWVEHAYPMNAGQRRGKYAGGLYWMRTERLGRRLFKGLLVPQFDTLAILRDTLSTLERKAFAEDLEARNVDVERFGQEKEVWGDAEWGLGKDAEEERKRKEEIRMRAMEKRLEEEQGREELRNVILENGEIPEEAEKNNVHIPADTVLEVIRSWAPLTVDAALTIPQITLPGGYGVFKEKTAAETWAEGVIKTWSNKLRKTARRLERLQSGKKAESEKAEPNQEGLEGFNKKIAAVENELEDLKNGDKSWKLREKHGQEMRQAWLRKVSAREESAQQQRRLKKTRSKMQKRWKVDYPAQREGHAIFEFSEERVGEKKEYKPWETEDKAAQFERRRKADLEREWASLSAAEKRALDGVEEGAYGKDGRGKQAKKRPKKKKNVEAKDIQPELSGLPELEHQIGESGGGAFEDALSGLEKETEPTTGKGRK